MGGDAVFVTLNWFVVLLVTFPVIGDEFLVR